LLRIDETWTWRGKKETGATHQPLNILKKCMPLSGETRGSDVSDEIGQALSNVGVFLQEPMLFQPQCENVKHMTLSGNKGTFLPVLHLCLI
jgi:hypothetical protein